MKRLFALMLFILLCVSLQAQHKKLQEKWKTIENAFQKGKLKSLKPELESILKLANKKKSFNDAYRAKIYLANINLITEPNFETAWLNYQQFLDFINESKGAERAIIASVTASSLYSFYQNNVYKIRNRSKLEVQNEEDFRAWSLHDFIKECHRLFSISRNENIASNHQDIKKWQPILLHGSKNTSSKILQPTIRDILFYRSLRFYDANKNSSELKDFDILKEFEKLASFHENHKQYDAYLYAKYKAISYDNLSVIQKNIAKEKLLMEYPKASFNGRIMLDLADSYKNRSDINGESGKVKAMALITQIKNQYPNSEISKEAQQLEDVIKHKSYNTAQEAYTSPERNVLLEVQHRNVSELFYKVLLINELDQPFEILKKEDKAEKNEYIKSLLNTYKTIKTASLKLKIFKDYESHETLKNFGKFKAGTYLVIWTNNPDFSYSEDDVYKYSVIQSSNYNFVYQGNTILLSHRESGLPAVNKTVKYAIHNYNNQSGSKYTKLSCVTDQKGMCELKLSSKRYNSIDIKVDDENVWYSRSIYNRKTNPKIDEDIKIEILTDRAIYRPGQTVYFKAIAYKQTTKNNFEVVPNYSDKIYLEDPNGNNVQEVSITTNEFGSFSSSFQLPRSGITGRFVLEIDDADYKNSPKEIRVEEYKRPKFSVEFDKINKVYNLNDSVKVKAKAIAFAGNPISDAKVAYRVTRQRHQPYRYYWSNSRPINYPKQIAEGELTTNKDGVATIPFLASINESHANDKHKIYTYTVYVDVTDLNGENHEQVMNLKIGDNNLLLSTNMPHEWVKESTEKLPIIATNLNGEKIDVKGTFKIWKLQASNRILIGFRQNAEYMDMEKSEFEKLFPNTVYPLNHNKEPKKLTQAWLSRFDTQKSRAIDLKKILAGLEKGRYLLELEAINKGDTLTYKKEFILNEKKNTTPIQKVFFKAQKVSYTDKVGDKAVFAFETSTSNALVRLRFTNEKGKVWDKELMLNNERKLLEIPLTLENEGQNYLEYFFTKYGVIESNKIQFYVQRTSKELTLKTKTFRDKLIPGAKETWELTIEGKDKEGLEAELLATMYDASLDEFVIHDLNFTPYSNRLQNNSFWSAFSFGKNNSSFLPGFTNYHYYHLPRLTFMQLNDFGLSFDERTIENNFRRINNIAYTNKEGIFMPPPPSATFERRASNLMSSSGIQADAIGEEIQGTASGISIRGASNLNAANSPLYVIDGVVMSSSEYKQIEPQDVAKMSVLKDASAVALYGAQAANGVVLITTKKKEQQDQALAQLEARKNFNETAFFFPELKTDKKGNIRFTFTTPESLTKWKFMAFGHTKDMRLGYISKETRTQKDLMVVPNVPRFLREDDTIILQTKVVNLSDKEQNATAQLFLSNPFTNEDLNNQFKNLGAAKTVKIDPKSSAIVAWKISVPKGIGAVSYKVVAQAGKFTDGESSVLPILSNRMLVTESMAMQVKGGEERSFSFDSFKSNKSKTLDQHAFTLEVMPNPVWNAVFALPYLQEYPHECSEQLFARIYGNAVAAHILNSNPKIQNVFKDWNTKDQLVSPLEKNEEIKNILLSESPWVRAAQSEKEQQKRIALLFDLNNLKNNLGKSLKKLQERQDNDGGFSWFPGGYRSQYISTYILAGIGRLKKMGVENLDLSDLNEIENQLITNVDKHMAKYLKEVRNKKKPKQNYSTSRILQYLYARSYTQKSHKNIALKDSDIKELLDTLASKGKWNDLQWSAKLALTFHRFGKKDWAKQVLETTKESVVEDPKMGMYWKSNVAGWNWQQAPIETQALLIEGYDEILEDEQSVEEMKIWLLQHKKNNRWSSTKSTTAAVYALLNHGANYLENPANDVQVWVGKEQITPITTQSGTGYYRQKWQKEAVKSELAEITLSKKSPGIAFAAAHWQYWEDLDQIQQANSEVQMKKALFVKTTKVKGQELVPITPETPIKVGDRVVVRLQVKADRAMEFLHIKDLRASGFEPVNVLSDYKWQDGLGYYESTRDAATHFFVERMPKGVYVFEYDLVANNAGNFSNGITQFQNMYAPELSAHSKGIRVNIKE